MSTDNRQADSTRGFNTTPTRATLRVRAASPAWACRDANASAKINYAARPIDLDLLLYDDLVIERDDLTLPDPHMLLRPFLAQGLYELAPELKLPGSDRSIAAVAAALSGKGMEPLPAFTERLRRLCGGGPKTT